MPSFPLHPELQQFEYSPVTRFPMSDQMSYFTDPYLIDSAEWGLKQSHRLDKPKVPRRIYNERYNVNVMVSCLTKLTAMVHVPRQVLSLLSILAIKCTYYLFCINTRVFNHELSVVILLFVDSAPGHKIVLVSTSAYAPSTCT